MRNWTVCQGNVKHLCIDTVPECVNTHLHGAAYESPVTVTSAETETEMKQSVEKVPRKTLTGTN